MPGGERGCRGGLAQMPDPPSRVGGGVGGEASSSSSESCVRIVSRSELVRPRAAPLPNRKNSSVYGSSSDARPG